MLIESLIKRKNGTEVEMDAPKRTYLFKPTDTDERHLADVDVEHHAKTLLRITEGYRAVDPVDFADDEDEDSLTARHLNGSNIHRASYVIKGGDTIELADLVNMAFADSGLTEEQWNDLVDEERYVYIDTTLAELQDGVNNEDQNAEPADQPGDADPESKDTRSDDAAPDQGNEGADAAQVAKQSDPEPSHADVSKDSNDDGDKPVSRADLAAQFKARFGRNPSTKMTIPQIQAALSEDDD